MSPIYLGNTEVSKVYKGTTEVTQAYLGTNTTLATGPTNTEHYGL